MGRSTEITHKMLEAFLTWAEAGTEQEAATKLGITQPAVHRKLEKFQSQLGTGPRLLQHGRSGWELTPEGKALLPVIRDLVRKFGQLEQHLSNREVAPRVIRIGTGVFAAQYILPRALATVRQKLPDCQIETHQERGLNRILFTADARFDLAIVTHSHKQVDLIVRKHFQTRNKLLNCKLVARFPMCVAACRGTLEGNSLAKFGKKQTLSLQDIAGWRLVGLDPQSGLRQRLEQLTDGAAANFTAETAAGGWPAAKAYAEQGLGAAILPIATLTTDDRSRFELRRFDERFVVEEYLISRADFPDPTVEVVAAEILASAAVQTRYADEFWDHI